MKLNVDQSLRKAAALSARGEMAAAEAIYRDVLARFPANKRARDGIAAFAPSVDPQAYGKGLDAIFALYDQGQLREAAEHLRLMLELYPSQPDLHNLSGAVFAGLGERERAIDAYDRAIALRPDHAEVHANRAGALIGLGRCDEALASCDAAIRVEPENAQAHANRGIALKQLNRPIEAVAAYDMALRLKPNAPEIHFNLANTLFQLGRHDEAIDVYDRALALRPTHVGALSNRGNALNALGRLDEAIHSYGRAIALDPNFAEAYSNLGNALLGQGRADDALVNCARAIELRPAVAEFHYNLAVVLEATGHLRDALTAYDNAIACDPNHARAHGNRGNLLFKLHRPAEAAESYARAVALDPTNAGRLYSLGNILQDIGRLEEAVDCYTRVIALNPDHGGAIAQLAYQRARMCDWAHGEMPDFDTLATADDISPLLLVWLEDAPELQLRHATRYAARKFAEIADTRPKPEIRPSKLRIGYFSAEFHDHAVMFQLVRVFELHDRDRFSIHAYSFGPNQASPMRSRLIEAFDVFHDVGAMSSHDIAELARAEGVDIAIDLMGYTGRARTELFAFRPAPVQMLYMGYPGTSGASFIDYLVADPILIPADQRQNYAEKIIWLPDSYQANDDQRGITSHVPSRAELGLPEQGFVFCCFNNPYKITPAEFDIWMRLLARVDGSVLWLFQANGKVQDNLRREAENRGIDPARIIFAGRMAHADHLARLSRADLFLDCFRCNAHATASDALWAGVPVLTVPGIGYAARVGASVLMAVGLPDMVAASREDYERIALELATSPERLTALKSRLAANVHTMPLFDSERFTRHIEKAFIHAFDRYQQGLVPDHIEVPALF